MNLIERIPDSLKEFEELIEYCKAVNPELKELEDLTIKWTNNKFPTEADEDGIYYFEQVLGLRPNKGESLEDRRFRVLARLNEKTPYTIIQLHRIMAALCGWEGYTLKVEDFILTLTLAMDSNSKLKSVMQMLRRVVPMHILIHVVQSVQYYGRYLLYCYEKLRVDITLLPFQLREYETSSKAFIYGYKKILANMTILPMQERELTLSSRADLYGANKVLINLKIGDING